LLLVEQRGGAVAIDLDRAVPERAWDLASEAGRLGVSLTHFRRLFRQIAGLSPQQYLIQRRLRLAAERLVETHDLVRQISGQTGFHSEFYFSRLFKQTYCLSPLEYRREFTPACQPPRPTVMRQRSGATAAPTR